MTLPEHVSSNLTLLFSALRYSGVTELDFNHDRFAAGFSAVILKFNIRDLLAADGLSHSVSEGHLLIRGSRVAILPLDHALATIRLRHLCQTKPEERYAGGLAGVFLRAFEDYKCPSSP